MDSNKPLQPETVYEYDSLSNRLVLHPGVSAEDLEIVRRDIRPGCTLVLDAYKDNTGNNAEGEYGTVHVSREMMETVFDKIGRLEVNKGTKVSHDDRVFSMIEDKDLIVVCHNGELIPQDSDGRGAFEGKPSLGALVFDRGSRIPPRTAHGCAISFLCEAKSPDTFGATVYGDLAIGNCSEAELNLDRKEWKNLYGKNMLEAKGSDKIVEFAREQYGKLAADERETVDSYSQKYLESCKEMQRILDNERVFDPAHAAEVKNLVEETARTIRDSGLSDDGDDGEIYGLVDALDEVEFNEDGMDRIKDALAAEIKSLPGFEEHAGYPEEFMQDFDKGWEALSDYTEEMPESDIEFIKSRKGHIIDRAEILKELDNDNPLMDPKEREKRCNEIGRVSRILLLAELLREFKNRSASVRDVVREKMPSYAMLNNLDSEFNGSSIASFKLFAKDLILTAGKIGLEEKTSEKLKNVFKSMSENYGAMSVHDDAAKKWEKTAESLSGKWDGTKAVISKYADLGDGNLSKVLFNGVDSLDSYGDPGVSETKKMLCNTYNAIIISAMAYTANTMKAAKTWASKTLPGIRWDESNKNDLFNTYLASLPDGQRKFKTWLSSLSFESDVKDVMEKYAEFSRDPETMKMIEHGRGLVSVRKRFENENAKTEDGLRTELTLFPGIDTDPETGKPLDYEQSERYDEDTHRNMLVLDSSSRAGNCVAVDTNLDGINIVDGTSREAFRAFRFAAENALREIEESSIEFSSVKETKGETPADTTYEMVTSFKSFDEMKRELLGIANEDDDKDNLNPGAYRDSMDEVIRTLESDILRENDPGKKLGKTAKLKNFTALRNMYEKYVAAKTLITENPTRNEWKVNRNLAIRNFRETLEDWKSKHANRKTKNFRTFKDVYEVVPELLSPENRAKYESLMLTEKDLLGNPDKMRAGKMFLSGNGSHKTDGTWVINGDRIIAGKEAFSDNTETFGINNGIGGVKLNKDHLEKGQFKGTPIWRVRLSLAGANMRQAVQMMQRDGLFRFMRIEEAAVQLAKELLELLFNIGRGGIELASSATLPARRNLTSQKVTELEKESRNKEAEFTKAKADSTELLVCLKDYSLDSHPRIMEVLNRDNPESCYNTAVKLLGSENVEQILSGDSKRLTDPEERTRFVKKIRDYANLAQSRLMDMSEDAEKAKERLEKAKDRLSRQDAELAERSNKRNAKQEIAENLNKTAMSKGGKIANKTFRNAYVRSGNAGK